MGHSSKYVTDAPAGHRLPHAATAPSTMTGPGTMDSKNHKHFQSHGHSHVSTPYPMLEHSSTMSSVSSDSSTGSSDYMQSHKQHHHHHRPSLPNPVHAVHNHMAEFRYGHATRSAKREARKSTSHPWSLEASLARGVNTIEERYEEVVEDWKEKDEQAWAEELRKRERARTSLAASPERKVEEVDV